MRGCGLHSFEAQYVTNTFTQ